MPSCGFLAVGGGLAANSLLWLLLVALIVAVFVFMLGRRVV